MSSGHKRIIVNALERAKSNDVNRLEAFAATAAQERMRHRVNREIVGSPISFPGLQQPFRTAISAPPADYQVNGDCFSGLMVRPDAAGFLLVDPGSMGMFMPAFAGLGVDDTPYVTVNDAGVSDTGTLTFTANAGPGIRWDIVECQPADVVLESTTRDIFDVPTQTFVPTLVDKVRAARLTYRIRNGTAGGGIPDIDPDWMPLAAVHVRTDSTGFDTCDVYDIRPLVYERHAWGQNHPLGNGAVGASDDQFQSVIREIEIGGFEDGAINGMYTNGYFLADFGGYWSGGDIRKNVPASDLANFGDGTSLGGSFLGFNWEDPLNQQSGGIATGANLMVALGAFFPRGYPRWVRYSQDPVTADVTNRLRVTGVRVPQGPRGILVATSSQPLGNGTIQPVAMPTHLGETDSAWGHVVAYALYRDTDQAMLPGIGLQNREFRFPIVQASAGLPFLNPFNSVSTLVGTITSATTWAVRGSINAGGFLVPQSAKAVLVRFRMTFTLTGVGGQISLGHPVASSPVAADNLSVAVDDLSASGFQHEVPAGPASTTLEVTGWVPLWSRNGWDHSGGRRAFVTVWGGNATGMVTGFGTLSADLLGYRI